jgi:hypothetical protein
VLDEASATRVRFTDLSDLLAGVRAEAGLDSSSDLEALGLFRDGTRSVAVRVERSDWETIWRNLFGNAIAAAGGALGPELRLGISAEMLRDPVTGTPSVSFVLADNLSGWLTTEMIRGRAAERGWGVVADLVRRHEGALDVVAAPGPGYRKGIRIELPAFEPGASE